MVILGLSRCQGPKSGFGTDSYSRNHPRDPKGEGEFGRGPSSVEGGKKAEGSPEGMDESGRTVVQTE